MSKHCPSCGSVVDDDAAECPVCGESLTEVAGTTSSTPGPSASEQRSDQPSDVGAAAIPVAAAGAPSAEPSRTICPDCGAANAPGATECSTCGASLAGIARDGRRTAAAPAARSDSKGAVQTYVIAGLAMVVIALVIYIASNPAEKTGPPMATTPGAAGAPGAAAQGQLPPDHPPIDQGAQMEALNKLVADLEAKVAAQPENDSLHLALANALYDVDRHADAKKHYSTYLAKNPNDLDATTDFATSVAAAGNVDSAVTVLNGVLAKEPKHQRAAFNMAIMYRQKENRDSIVYWLKRVAEIDSTTPTGKGAIDILKDLDTPQP